MRSNSLTQERLKEILHYNLGTGVFTWIDCNSVKPMNGKTAGTKHNMGYTSIGIDGKVYLSHRLAWLYVDGFFPDQVDHIDHDRSNTKYKNLRAANESMNSKNRTKTSRNTAGVVGVCWCKLNKKWKASITVNRKKIHLGLFKDITKAKECRSKAKIKYGFHPNHD